MVKRKEQIVIRAIALCFKPFLKPEEALIYCNLGRTQFAKNCEIYGVGKSISGYFKREDLDRMLSGSIEAPSMKIKSGSS
ncbi:MAG TPA: hypothetical protein VGG71_15085 [Chitinophagaceae bacterium]|jgi:hypothetical protein